MIDADLSPGWVKRLLADVDARRVFADELLEQKDVRGELIHLQLALATSKNPAQLRRHNKLMREHAATWLAEFPTYCEPELRGGFITHASINVFFLEASATAQLFRRAPLLSSIELFSDFGGLIGVFQRPELETKRDAAVGRILKSLEPFGAQLEQLRVKLQLEDAELKVLLEVAPRITELDVSRNALGYASARLLASQKLRSLRLGRNRVGAEGGKVLLAASGLQALEVLDVSNNGLTASSLVDARPWPTLHTLDLSGNVLGIDGVRRLVQLELPALKSLGLRQTALPKEAVAILQAWPVLKRLERLDVDKNDFKPDTVSGLEPR